MRYLLCIFCCVLLGCQESGTPPASRTVAEVPVPDPVLLKLESLERELQAVKAVSAIAATKPKVDDPRPVVTAYSAPWCPPCRVMKREWDHDEFRLVVVDDPALHPQWVQVLPTFEIYCHKQAYTLRGWNGRTWFKAKYKAVCR